MTKTIPAELQIGGNVAEDWRTINELIELLDQQAKDIAALKLAVENLRRNNDAGAGADDPRWR
jgi:hypothetical protein